MFRKHLLVYINSKVPFHENLPPLPSHCSGVPGNIAYTNNDWKTYQTLRSMLNTRNKVCDECMSVCVLQNV
jgi:hypothetical protein